MFSIQYDDFANIIDGKKRGSQTVSHGVNPATGDRLWDVPVASQQDLDDAVRAATRAFHTYSLTSIQDRKALLSRFQERIEAEAELLTDLICIENGKPRRIAEWDTKGVAEWFDHHIRLAIPECEEVRGGDLTLSTRYTPLGVVAAICPWNFPLLLCLGKIIPAILMGNTIIVKPSPFTPYSTLKLVEIGQSVFPPGVLQAIGGDDKLGPMITAHPGIAKISFTGSTATGKRIMIAGAGSMKRLTLELGGNDACIIMPDVDVEAIAPDVVEGVFMNSGQICIGTKRIYIYEDIYDKMLAAMVTIVKPMTVGGPDRNATMGPVQNIMQFERVKDFIRNSQEKGHKFATGEPRWATAGGYFI